MRSSTPAKSVFHALVIGADFYFENRLSNDGRYASLNGCVADALAVEAMLQKRLEGHATTTFAPVRLLASNDGARRPPEDEALWPTAANIRAALDDLAKRVRPGDQVYIHYSGHGGRVTTSFPERKGARGEDEALVPIDIGGGPGTVATRYIRDVELVGHLDKIVRKGDPLGGGRVVVTVNLDACHSGGALRGTLVAKRSATAGRPTPRDRHGTLDETPISDLDAAASTFAAEAKRAYERAVSATRGTAVQTTWLPRSDDYVLLAACRDTESAMEASIDGAPPGGVMTHAFLEALRTLGEDQSWKTVYDRVLARVNSRFPSQTPQLLGQLDRQIFGVRLLPAPRSIGVLEVDAAERRVKVAAGVAMAVPRGAELGVYRPGTVDFSADEGRVATATIVDAGASDSWATIDNGDDVTKIEPGSPAILLALPIRRKVELLRRDDVPPGVAASEDAALAAVSAALDEGNRGFLELGAGAETPHYQVVVNERNEYAIRDGAGQALAYMNPAIRVGARNAARSVVDRLLRLCRFHTVLEMAEPSSALDDRITVALLRPPPGWTPDQSTEKEESVPLPLTGDSYVLTSGDYVFIRITNDDFQPINVAALDLQCDWGITMIVPDKASTGACYEVVGGGEVRTFAVQVFVPDGFDETPDVFEVFASIDHADFTWLEQPAVGDPFKGVDRSATVRGGGHGPLARLFAMLDVPENRIRHAAAVSPPNASFTMRQFRVLVKKH